MAASNPSIWMDVICRGSIGFQKSKDPKDGTEQALLNEFSSFNVYIKENGPYINGEEISAADLSFRTKAIYHMEIALGHYKSWSVPESLPSVKSYMQILRQNPTPQRRYRCRIQSMDPNPRKYLSKHNYY